MAHEQNGDVDRGTQLILTEIRDLRREMHADRQSADAERRHADEAWREERRQADAERRQADTAWQQERRQTEEAWQQEVRRLEEAQRQDRVASDARFEQTMREFRQDSGRREVTTQKAFKDIHTVGLAVVKTLNRHTRILEQHGRVLERIDRKLGVRGNGRPGRNDGRES